MALTGDYYFGEYEGHAIELVWNNWNKTVTLRLDGTEMDRASCLFPGRIRLIGRLVHDGLPRTVVADSVPHLLIFTRDNVSVDGEELPLIPGRPRGLFKELVRDAGDGHPTSVLTVGALALVLLVLIAAVVIGLLWR
jgi:hypothetical protein